MHLFAAQPGGLSGGEGKETMQADVMFLDCPADMDDHGAARCGLPATVEYRYAVESSSGPLESAKIRCPRGHIFNGPVEFLAFTSGGVRLAADSRGGARRG